MNSIRKTAQLLGQSGLDAVCAVIVSIVMTGIVALTVVDVVGRYWFNSSIEGGFEITELLLVLLIFSALPLVSKRDMHITIDLINPILSRSVKATSDVVNQIISGLVFLAMSLFLWNHAGRLEEYNDVTAILHISLYPFVYFISIFSSFGSLLHFMKAAVLIFKKHD